MTSVTCSEDRHWGPSGGHYTLNLIGVPRDKTADMDGHNGHRIFGKLYGNTKINLAEDDDFQVLDANGTDNEGSARPAATASSRRAPPTR